MSNPIDPKPSRLEWTGADGVDRTTLESIVGPGAAFEYREQLVGGRRREVFVRQPPNLRRFLEGVADDKADLVYLVEGDSAWTYRQVAREVDRIAAELAGAHGVGIGDRVAIVSANSVSYALAFWAVTSLGAIVTSLNGWWTGPELLHGIELTDPVVILGDERRLERVAGADSGSSRPMIELEELRRDAAGRDPDRFEPASPEPDDPAVILFTSGTTGRPKGAVLTHRSILHFVWANLCMAAIGTVSGPRPADAPGTGGPRSQPGRILASPLFHVSGLAGLVMSGPAFGLKQVIPPPGRWDETEHLDLTVRHHVVSWSGVPTQFRRLIRHPRLADYDLRAVRSIGGGGAPFPPELVREIRSKMPQVSIGTGYGMSESMGLGTRVGGEAMAATPGAVGGANVTVRIEIRDPRGRVVPEGEVGEIHIDTAALFAGYWRDEEATDAAFDDDGWYRTGDFGRVRDGELVLESRMRDLIIRGGENVYPIEVEHRLMEHPEVEDVAVVGVDHDVLGQEVEAHVVRCGGSTVTADELRSWAGERLAAFKVPARIFFVDELPYTETGKVLKHLLVRAPEPAPSAGG